MKISKRTPLTALFHLSLFLLGCSACIIMLNDIRRGGTNYIVAVVFMLWAVFALKPLENGYKLEKPSTTLFLFNIYFMWVIFVTAVIPDTHLLESAPGRYLMLMISAALPFLIANTVYYFILHRGNDKHFLDNIAVMTAMLILIYFHSYSLAMVISEDTHFNGSYYSLFLLPLIMMNRRKTVKYIGLILICIALFLSVKRGGILALFLAIIAYLLFSQWVKTNKSTAAKLTSAILVGAIFTALFVYSASMGNNNIMERFENTENDSGSGRTFVWDETWRLINDQGITNYMIGNGFNAVVNNSRYALSAHNDYLEAWYDFGLVGLVLYSLSVLSMFTANIKAIIAKKPYAPAFSMFSSIYMVLSLVSHIGIYYWMTLSAINIGYFIGLIDYDKKHASVETEGGRHVEA